MTGAPVQPPIPNPRVTFTKSPCRPNRLPVGTESTRSASPGRRRAAASQDQRAGAPYPHVPSTPPPPSPTHSTGADWKARVTMSLLYGPRRPQRESTLGSVLCKGQGPRGACVCVWGHEATDTELTYAPVSQAYGHCHKLQFNV